ncbi:hypothetical protein TrST_g12383 [Triparma strigata]|nr:hypothetical protein TrST_g12383 [Triparma strigata]
MEREEDEEVAGGVRFKEECMVDSKLGTVVMHENKECVWMTVVGEMGGEEEEMKKKKVKGNDDGNSSSSSSSSVNSATSHPFSSPQTFLRKPKLSLGNTYMNLEPPLNWSSFCSSCGLPAPPQAGSLSIIKQSNISFEPLIRSVMSEVEVFKKARLTDYAADLVGSKFGGTSIIIAMVLEIEPRDAHLHIHQGRVPLLVKGVVVSVSWQEPSSPFKIIQWVNPPPFHGSKKLPRAGESTQRLHMLAKSLAAKHRKKHIKTQCVKLDNEEILKLQSKEVIVNSAMPLFNVTM